MIYLNKNSKIYLLNNFVKIENNKIKIKYNKTRKYLGIYDISFN